jgi:hypothetical protein
MVVAAKHAPGCTGVSPVNQAEETLDPFALFVKRQALGDHPLCHLIQRYHVQSYQE